MLQGINIFARALKHLLAVLGHRFVGDIGHNRTAGDISFITASFNVLNWMTQLVRMLF